MPTINLSCDQQFSLDLTLGCGQVFRWDRADNGWWFGIVGRQVIKIRQNDCSSSFKGATVPFIKEYFSLDVDLQPIIASFNRDPFIEIAIRRCAGLRLIRQPGWECLISYICSTNSNIPMIRRRIGTIAEQFGREIFFEGKIYYTFPEPSDIACSGKEHLEICKLGYRTPYVFKTACDISNQEQWEETIVSMSFEAATQGTYETLRCRDQRPPTASSSLHSRNTSRSRSMSGSAGSCTITISGTLKTDTALTAREYDLIRRFARKHFGEFCGYAQEYLYAARRE